MMPGERRPGMDHDLYKYSPLPLRPPLSWPNGARLAWTITIHVDWWELGREPGTDRSPGLHGPWGSFEPDWRTFTYREFGHRIGIFRVLDVLDRFGLRATIALGSEAARRYPEIVAACRRRNHDFAAHGTHATRIITSRMSEAEERDHIAEAISAIERATGRRPSGWVGQDFGQTTRTADLLLEAGLSWFGDWPNDDQPYRFTNGLIALPYQPEWDDVQLLWSKLVPTWEYPQIVADAADRLWQEGGRVLGLNIRPWLFGQAGRIGYLDAALADLVARENIWTATAEEIARHIEGSGR